MTLAQLPEIEMSPSELAHRVTYAFLQQSAEFAVVLGLSLKAFERVAHMAAFHVLRDRGLNLSQIAAQLGVSRRKVDQLSRRLKDNFFDRLGDAESDEALRRRIEFAVWAEPLSAVRLKQVLSTVAPERIDAALATLVQDERVAMTDEKRPRYRPTAPKRRLVRDNWMARVHGLNHQLSAVGSAAFGRFFRSDDRAFARTVSMRVRKDRVADLEAFYRDVVWPHLVGLDAECQDAADDDVEGILFSLCWATADGLSRAPLGANAPEEEES